MPGYDSKTDQLLRNEETRNEMIFKVIPPSHPSLPSVIRSSIGAPTKEKIVQVLQSYTQPNQYLVGAFDKEKLVGVIGFQLTLSQAIIRHISVQRDYRGKGIGRDLVHFLSQEFHPCTIEAETDEEALGFYQSLNFACQPFQGTYGSQYSCLLDLTRK
ncbi:MAG: GNAT family N-acetyltransferase [Candidatus Paracaedibacteraceae bacterium]|nr:GNAT family N-acetyltransferase [Candidatus Paracaedibacteraceae bacterium]